jgi:hypothetical protein
MENSISVVGFRNANVEAFCLTALFGCVLLAGEIITPNHRIADVYTTLLVG